MAIQIDHIDCFKQESADALLPAAIDGARLIQEITGGTEEVMKAVEQCYSRESPSTFSRNQSNGGRVNILAGELTNELAGETIRTFGDLRRANTKARKIVREAVIGHQEYPSRAMDIAIQEAVTKTFAAICKKIHGEIDAGLAANAEERMKQTKEIQHRSLMHKLSVMLTGKAGELKADGNGKLFAPGESVNDEGVNHFSEFLLLVEVAVTEANQADTPFSRAAVLGHVQTFCEGDSRQTALFTDWAMSLPESVPMKAINGTPHTNALSHFDAHAILMPKKTAVLRERKDPDGLPEWTMTPQEDDALRDVIRTDGAGRTETTLADDAEFLSLAAGIINEQCSSGKPVVRGPIEVKKALTRFAVPVPDLSAVAPAGAKVEPVPVIEPPVVQKAPAAVMKEKPAASPLSEWPLEKAIALALELKNDQEKNGFAGAKARLAEKYSMRVWVLDMILVKAGKLPVAKPLAPSPAPAPKQPAPVVAKSPPDPTAPKFHPRAPELVFKKKPDDVDGE